ncbi:hypothetical protein GCM10009693_06940 [Leucobacter chromiireducens subsp. chromiireducens]
MLSGDALGELLHVAGKLCGKRVHRAIRGKSGHRERAEWHCPNRGGAAHPKRCPALLVQSGLKLAEKHGAPAVFGADELDVPTIHECGKHLRNRAASCAHTSPWSSGMFAGRAPGCARKTSLMSPTLEVPDCARTLFSVSAVPRALSSVQGATEAGTVDHGTAGRRPRSTPRAHRAAGIPHRCSFDVLAQKSRSVPV